MKRIDFWLKEMVSIIKEGSDDLEATSKAFLILLNLAVEANQRRMFKTPGVVQCVILIIRKSSSPPKVKKQALNLLLKLSECSANWIPMFETFGLMETLMAILKKWKGSAFKMAVNTLQNMTGAKVNLIPMFGKVQNDLDDIMMPLATDLDRKEDELAVASYYSNLYCSRENRLSLLESESVHEFLDSAPSPNLVLPILQPLTFEEAGCWIAAKTMPIRLSFQFSPMIMSTQLITFWMDVYANMMSVEELVIDLYTPNVVNVVVSQFIAARSKENILVLIRIIRQWSQVKRTRADLVKYPIILSRLKEISLEGGRKRATWEALMAYANLTENKDQLIVKEEPLRVLVNCILYAAIYQPNETTWKLKTILIPLSSLAQSPTIREQLKNTSLLRLLPRAFKRSERANDEKSISLISEILRMFRLPSFVRSIAVGAGEDWRNVDSIFTTIEWSKDEEKVKRAMEHLSKECGRFPITIVDEWKRWRCP